MFLEKKDFSLYYEVRGEGAPLLLIHGVIVDSGLFEEGAKLLSGDYKVITYDRRGNSRSAFHQEADRSFSMEDQAEDIKDLLDALSIEKTYIFGASAGAAIGQYFMAKYPERVLHLIMYEPASLSLVSGEDGSLREWVREIEAQIAKKRFNRALLNFSQSIGAPDPEGRKKSAAEALREYGNIEYAMTVELPKILAYIPDTDRMRGMREKITVAMGELNPDTVYHRIAPKFARKIGNEMVLYPGGHNFPYERPEEFAACVRATLRK